MRKQWYRRISVIVGLIAMFGILVSCAQPAPSPSPKAAEAPKAAAGGPKAAAKAAGTEIRIGLTKPFTGVLGEFGLRGRIAARMAVDEVNAAGGINGVPIKLYEEDEESVEQQAAKMFLKLAFDTKVLAVLGPWNNSSHSTTYPYAAQAKVPMLVPTPWMPGVGKQSQPWGVSFNIPDETMIPPTVKAYIKKYNVKRLASIYANDHPYLLGLGEQLMAAFKAQGIQVLDPIFIKQGDTEWSAAITRLKGLNADGLALTNMSHRAGPMIVEMRRQGINIPVVGSTVLADGGMIATGGDAVEGAITGTMYWNENPNPQQVRFAKMYYDRAMIENSKSPDPDSFVADDYDIIRVLAKVMKEGGITNRPEDLAKDRQIIMDGIRALKDFDGVGSKLTMGPDGQIMRDYFVVIVQGGKFQRLPE